MLATQSPYWQCGVFNLVRRDHFVRTGLGLADFGSSKDVSLAILGVGLLVFAVTLVINARRQQVKTSDAWIVVLMDLAWVLGSYVLIFVVPFSIEGKWVVGVVAELVSVFALLQFIDIRRIQKNRSSGNCSTP
jgi:hypothetical protein